ncbi:MAG: M23 family metallopeptidase, partial [Anaerolineales bacterium]
MKPPRNLIFCLPLVYLVAACRAPKVVSLSPSPAQYTTPAISIATQAAAPTETALPSPPAPSPTAKILKSVVPASPTTAAPEVCSPLQDIPTSQLAEMISNPFSPPPPGSDDPHQGVDFADLSGEQRIALAGRQVNAVLPGKVVLVIEDRFPYGNAVLVETPIQDLPGALASILPTPAPTPERKAALTCPEDSHRLFWDTTNRSLYLLYAHLQEPPALQPGDSLSCGQKVGSIGSSGNALNPHLHLEARLG